MRRAFERLAADVRRVLGSRLTAVVATGPASSVVFVERLEPGDIVALGALVETWHHDDLETPLVLTDGEFLRSLDAFPLEYQALVDRHVVIAGDPPFAGAPIDPAHLRRACEVQAKAHLLHLRQGWLEAAGHDDRLADLIAASAGPLRVLLANVARLHGVVPADTDAAINGARLAGLDTHLIAAVLALESHPEDAHSLVARMADYGAASEALWKYVDEWQA